MSEQRKLPHGISMAEAQRRAVILAKMIRKHGHSAPLSQMAEAERGVFDAWYSRASLGAKLAYWTQRARSLVGDRV